jgi:hypothetical protein
MTLSEEEQQKYNAELVNHPSLLFMRIQERAGGGHSHCSGKKARVLNKYKDEINNIKNKSWKFYLKVKKHISLFIATFRELLRGALQISHTISTGSFNG